MQAGGRKHWELQSCADFADLYGTQWMGMSLYYAYKLKESMRERGTDWNLKLHYKLHDIRRAMRNDGLTDLLQMQFWTIEDY